MLNVSLDTDLTPFQGYIDGLPCKQGRSTKDINTFDIEQEPYTPMTYNENQLLLWQAKAIADSH
jgi:hypothetical protein